MNKGIKLSKELNVKLINKGTVSNSIEFGRGNLMPIYSLGKEDANMIIAKHAGFNEVGQMVPAEEGVILAEGAEPLVMLSFPKNETGLKSIQAVREWLDQLEGFVRDKGEDE